MHPWRLTRQVFPLAIITAVLSTVLVVGSNDPADSRVAPSAPAPSPAKIYEREVPRPAAHVAAASPDTAPPLTQNVVAELPETTVEPYSLVGVTWASATKSSDLVVQVRWRDRYTWSKWTDLELDLANTATEGGRPGTEPRWVGSADGVAVRVTSAAGAKPADLKVATIDPGNNDEVTPVSFQSDATDVAPAALVKAASVPTPAIILRSAWGASGGGTCDSPLYGETTRGAVIHHTAGTNSYTKSQSASIVKATQAYHTGSQNWCDIGYNFLVDKYGQIFEGRRGGITKTVRGAHSGNGAVNVETMGVSLMGEFTSTDVSAAMKTAVVKLVSWRFDDYSVPAKGTYRLGGLTLNRIAGHRNVVSTACPGARAYSWLGASGGLRDRVEDALVDNSTSFATPTNLRSTATTKGSISLAWNAVPDAPQYRIQLSKSSNMSGAVYYRFLPASATITGLTANTTYYAKVRVITADGGTLSNYSNPAIVVKTASYDVPKNLRSTATTKDSISLAWDAVPDAPQYRIQLSKSSDMADAVFYRFLPASATITGLTANTTYYAKVRVITADGGTLSAYSATALSTKTLASTATQTTVFATPRNLRSTATAKDSISLAWDAVPDAPKYRIKLSKSSDMTNAVFYRFLPASATITGLTANTTYYAQVRVITADGGTLSNYSNPAIVVKTAAYDVPKNLRSTATTKGSISLAWDAVPDAPKYRIQLSKSSNMSGAVYYRFLPASATITGLAANTTYYAKVRVITADGGTLSNYSNPAIVVKTAPYDVPKNLRFTATTKDSISLAWDAVADAPQYRIKLSKSSDMANAVFYRFPSTTAKITGLTANTTYYAKVRVITADGATLSAYSATALSTKTLASTATQTTVFATPRNLRSTATAKDSISWAWDAVPGAPKYRIQLSKSSNMAGAVYYRFDTTTAKITGLTASTTYYAKVRVITADGAPLSPYSTTATSARTASNAVAESYTVPSSRMIALTGHGYGHGIGMGQYGAQGAAKQLKKYDWILAHYYPGTALGTKTGNIRVLLSRDSSNSVMVTGRSGLVFRNLATNKTIALPTIIGGKSVIRWSINPTAGKTTQSSLQYRTGTSWVTYQSTNWTGNGQFEGPSYMTLILPDGSGMKFRGALRSSLPKTGATNRDTVNVLSVENYTRGVVSAEMPSSWMPEALKAQSVAARTYGVRSLRPTHYYDICDTTSCQVYGGVARETTPTDSAIVATKSKILTYGGTPAFTQFSSSSGGYSATGSQPYLKAVNDPYDDFAGNANHEWKTSVAASKIEKAYSTIGILKQLKITKRTGVGDWGGRVASISLVGSKSTVVISGNTARTSFGLKSNWFRLGG